jgi:branched-chain amino acid transport system permease protein
MIFNQTLFIEMLENGVFTGAMYALMALGFSLLWGILNLFNFGHGGLYMFGAYLTWVLVSQFGINVVLAIFLTFLIMFVLGMVIEVFLIRPLGKYRGRDEWVMGTIVVTLMVAVFFEAGALSIFGGNFKTLPAVITKVLEVGPFRASYQMILSFTLAIFLILAMWRFLISTKTGLAMQALAQEDDGAQMVGINPNFIYTLTFGISAAFAGTAGALLAPIYNIYPDVGWQIFGKAFVVVMIGGLGRISGTIYAGVLLGLLESFSNIFISAKWTPVISYLFMIFVLLVKPKGLFGIKER